MIAYCNEHRLCHHSLFWRFNSRACMPLLLYVLEMQKKCTTKITSPLVSGTTTIHLHHLTTAVERKRRRDTMPCIKRTQAPKFRPPSFPTFPLQCSRIRIDVMHEIVIASWTSISRRPLVSVKAREVTMARSSFMFTLM